MSTRPSLEEIMGRKMQRAHPPLSLIKKRRRTRLATILICGSPADGFQIIGLFADRDDARSYAEALMRTRRRRRRLILLRAQDPSRPLAQRPPCPIPRPFSAAPSPGGRLRAMK